MAARGRCPRPRDYLPLSCVIRARENENTRLRLAPPHTRGRRPTTYPWASRLCTQPQNPGRLLSERLSVCAGPLFKNLYRGVVPPLLAVTPSWTGLARPRILCVFCGQAR